MTPTEIRALRARLNLSQKQLAEALLVSRETVVRWESPSSHSRPRRIYVEAMHKLANSAAPVAALPPFSPSVL